MKPYNDKQIKHSRKKVAFATGRMQRNFILLFMLIISLPVAGIAITNPELPLLEVISSVLFGNGMVGIASMSVIGDIGEISDKYSSPKQIGMRVYLVAVEQIDQDAAYPTPNASREIGTIPLKTGEYMQYMEAVDGTQDENATGEKGDIITTTTRNFVYTIAGNRDKSLDFLEEYSGKGFVLIYSIGEDETKYLLGSPFKPMVLSNYERKGGGPDGRYITLTFSSEYWRQPLKYIGSIVRQAPDTVSQDATTIPITDNDRYRLSDGSSATVTITSVSGIGSADYGRVITVLAPETASYPPEIADGSTFVMIDAQTWTANPGSSISFKILDDATLIEVEGSRVQTA